MSVKAVYRQWLIVGGVWAKESGALCARATFIPKNRVQILL